MLNFKIMHINISQIKKKIYLKKIWKHKITLIVIAHNPEFLKIQKQIQY